MATKPAKLVGKGKSRGDRKVTTAASGRYLAKAGTGGDYAVVTRNGKRFVLVPTKDYNRMKKVAEAGVGESPAGAVDALAFADRTIAESIVRDRNLVGLSQQELAERAGIRVEVLNRAERGVVVPSVRTLTKIEKALVGAGLRRGGR